MAIGRNKSPAHGRRPGLVNAIEQRESLLRSPALRGTVTDASVPNPLSTLQASIPASPDYFKFDSTTQLSASAHVQHAIQRHQQMSFEPNMPDKIPMPLAYGVGKKLCIGELDWKNGNNIDEAPAAGSQGKGATTSFSQLLPTSCNSPIQHHSQHAFGRSFQSSVHAGNLPKGITFDTALSQQHMSEEQQPWEQSKLRNAFEQQNMQLMNLAASAERRCSEVENENVMLRRELANMKEGMHMNSLRANEEAMIRISQLQMQLAQAQSEASTSADINAAHMRDKLLLASELDNLRAEIPLLKTKLDSRSRGADAEVQALVNENMELNRSLSINRRDLVQVEVESKALSERMYHFQMNATETEHQRRKAEEELVFMHEQLRLKTLELGTIKDEMAKAS